MSTQTSPSSVSKTTGVPTPAVSNRTSRKPPVFMLPLMKTPLILYRLGLGWLLGKRFMQITHVGRRSGKVYRTVLAVMRYDAATREIMAVSPWSASNWYRNIQDTPALEVETGDIRGGRVRYAPVQRSLSPEEIATLLIEFCRRYPIFSRIVARIPGWNVDSTYEEFLELARTLRGVAFLPRGSD